MPNPKGYNQYKRGPGSSSTAKGTRKGPTAADAMALKAKYPNLPIGGVPGASGFSVKLGSTTVPPKTRAPKNTKKATPKPKTKPKAKPKTPRRAPTRADAIALKAKYPNLPITVGR
jgi:hypothetical protein